MVEQAVNSGNIFTNEHHQIIYIDKTLQVLLGQTQDWIGKTLGTPVNDLFGLSLSRYQELLRNYQADGRFDNVSLELVAEDGQRISSLVTGVINRDEQNRQMGVDYHIEVIATSTAPLNVQAVSDTIIDEVVRFYFKRQMEALYETTVMWGGIRLGDYLNKIINETSQENNWHIVMTTEKISIEEGAISVDAYIGLMAKASAYISSLIGSQLVHREIEAVNDKTNATTFEHIDRDWYKIPGEKA